MEDKTKNFIVTLLGTTNYPIRGRTLLVKEAFLFLKNMDKELVDPPEISFFPHRYGPYSRYLSNKLRELVIDGVITIYGNKIGLSHVGDSILNNIRSRYSDEEWRALKEFRIKLDQKGTDGIMKVVYEKFPEYTVNSKVKDRYLSKRKDKKERN